MKRLALFTLIISVALSGCSRDSKVKRDKYFASGQIYLENKKYEEAAIEFRNALQLDIGHTPSHLAIAKAFQQMGDHQNAVIAFQQVIKLDGKNVEARLQLGDYLILAGAKTPGLLRQAQQMAEEALKLQPSNVEALILLGNAYSSQNQIDKSIVQIKKALSLNPGNLKALVSLGNAYLKNKDTESAENTFKEAVQQHPDSTQPHLAIAVFYAAASRAAEAENHLKKAFDLAPADPRCLYALATFYISAKKPSEAEKVFMEAIALNPKDREPRWGLAMFYFQQGLADKGASALQEVLEVNPGDHMAQLRFAELYLSQNNEAKAEEIIRSLLAAYKNDPEAHYLQGRLLLQRQAADKALAEFDTAIRLDAALFPPYMAKANLQMARGDLQGAQSTLDAVLPYDRNNMVARAALAKVLAFRQKPQDALQWAEEVLRAMPDNEDALIGRAEALRLQGNLEEAGKDYQKLCDLRPKNAFYWHRLGMVEILRGQSSLALTHFRKALEVRPDFITAISDILSIHLKGKKFDAALAELDRLSAFSSPRDELHRLRGQVYLAKGDLSEGEREFRKAIEVNPQNYQSYILLAQLSMQRKDVLQALKEVDQLIARNDKLAAAFFLKADYLRVSNDVPGAIANYRRALQLDPDAPVTANNLAWLLCESNINLDEALSLARLARKAAPENPDIADTLGWIYYKKKNYTLAVDQLLFSLNGRRQPASENYYRLGMAYYAKGDLVLAKQALRKSLELSASFPGADEARKILKSLG